MLLEGEFVGDLERPDLDGLHRGQREEQEDGLLQPVVDHDVVGRGIDLGDPRLAPVEEIDGLVDDGGRLGVALLEARPVFPQFLDLRLEVGHGPTVWPS